MVAAIRISGPRGRSGCVPRRGSRRPSRGTPPSRPCRGRRSGSTRRRTRRRRASAGRCAARAARERRARDHRQDAEADRERRAGLEAERPHAVPVVLTDDRPLDRVRADDAVDDDEGADREQRARRPCLRATNPSGSAARAGRRTRATPRRSPTQHAAHASSWRTSTATSASAIVAIVDRRPSPASERKATRAKSANVGYARTSGKQEGGVEERRGAHRPECGDRRRASARRGVRARRKTGSRPPP